MMPMQNKLPKFFDNHKICIICEGNEEYEYLNRLKNLKVWNEQYDISLVNAGGNGNIPARYQDRYQNGADELVLVFCDTEEKNVFISGRQCRTLWIISFVCLPGSGKNECRSGKQELLCDSRSGANPLCRGQDLWSGTC